MRNVLGNAAVRMVSPRGPRRRWTLLGVLVAVALPVVVIGIPAGILTVIVGGTTEEAAADTPGCVDPNLETAMVATDLSEEQLQNAATIIAEGKAAEVPAYGWVVALATAMQESQLVNLDHGDRDSLGLFQQRPSSGWGSPAQIRDPVLSARAFYGVADHTNNPGLLQIRNWESLSVTEAAQAVQRSAFPNAYAKWEVLARTLVATIDGTNVDLCGDGDAMTCPATGLEAETGLLPDAIRVIRCLSENFPAISGFAGIGDRPSNDDSDHPDGRAVDAMIADWDTPAGNAFGTEVAEWARANASALGIKYVIWDAKIWSVERNDEDWRPYEHPSGATDPTSTHRDHVHVSVYGNSAGGGGDIGQVALPIQAGDYRLTARFGECGGRWSACHTGLDFAAPLGTPIRAIAAGEVSSVANAGA